MNKGELRTHALNQRSWHADTDDDFEQEVDDSCIDPAMKKLAKDVPEAFIPATERVYVYKDETHTTLSRTIASTTDPWVMSFGLAAGGTAMVVNGTRDAITHLEVLSPDGDGVVFRYRCREFWLQDTGVPNAPHEGEYLVSLDRPWRNSTDTAMQFRLFQPGFYLRDDTMRLVDGEVWDEQHRACSLLPAGHDRLIAWQDYRGDTNGRPEAFQQAQFESLRSPNRAPVVSLNVSVTSPPGPPNPWLGPEPPGTFTYRYTYGWAVRDFQLAAPGGMYDPVFESSPSPPSAEIIAPDMTRAVDLSSLVNIDFQQGFDTATTLRATHSGWVKYIYRARTAVFAGSGTVQEIEYPGIYHRIAVVDGADTTWEDDGSVIPDYDRRLPESQGYHAWKCVPHQDATYQIDLRVYRRPAKLLSDYDAPQILPQFEECLNLLIYHYLCILEKQPEEAAIALQKYKDAVGDYRAQEANPAPYVEGPCWAPDDTYRDITRYTGVIS